ncbi:MAG: D-galactarate dehydratase [Bacilli bacterium]|nr:D-galactarate dehydratase [Bacilli bacterium]
MAHHEVTSDIDAIAIDSKDQVATALRDLKAGDTIAYRLGEDIFKVAAIKDIPFGHKIAIRSVNAGQPVYKYGEVIGAATTDIAIGDHVHVHNIEGIRGRGDHASGKKGE